MSKTKKASTFEEIFQKLEDIVQQLESGQTTVEKSMELFEEGVKLSTQCRTKLDEADQKIKELVKSSENTFDLKDL